MKIAYCINDNGEKFQVKATDEFCKKYKNRLFCPYCGEKVDPYINGKKQAKHFRHHHGSYREECENYCKFISIGSFVEPYEREGLPLYLIKELGQFYLYLGLYGLEEKTIEEAENANLQIQIDVYKDSILNKKVNSKDFIPRTIEFIKINYVKQRYNLKFNTNTVSEEIRTKWPTYVNGIGPNGAIFNFGKYGGKKISSSVGLKVNEEYLLFTKENMKNKFMDNISFELIQQSNYGCLKTYKIYKFIIKDINENTISFCEKFDLKLSYSKPEVVPIWPPCVSMEHELIYEYDGNKYFTVTSDDPNEKKVYSYSLKERINSQFITNKKDFIRMCLKTDDFILLGDLNNQFIYSIVKKSLKNIDIEPKINISTISRKLIIDAKTKVIINSYNKKLLIKSRLIKEEQPIQIKYNKNEKLQILYGLDVIWSNEEETQEERNLDIDSLDNKLLHKIYMCRGETVDIPNTFKWMILKKRKYHRSFRELQKVLREKKVYIELINLLKKY